MNTPTWENYHAVERILTDFKNGATYSDSIEKIHRIEQEARADERRKVVDRVRDLLQYMEDKTRFTESLGYPFVHQSLQEARERILEEARTGSKSEGVN